MEKLGVVGGLGPAATARLMERVVFFTDVACDQDHLDVTVLNRPWIPDRTSYLTRKRGAVSFVEPMREAALELEACGCAVLCTPCNTAHARLDDIAAPLETARFVHMPRETARFVADLGVERVAVLGTDGTRIAGVYDEAFAAVGMSAVYPDEERQREVMATIYDEVKAGRCDGPGHVEALCAAMAKDGCDGIVLGCTELSAVGCAPVVAGAAEGAALSAWSAEGGPVREGLRQERFAWRQPKEWVARRTSCASSTRCRASSPLGCS
ncbi:Aspartate racemase [Coriobacteriaceae bacterium CHKCI002]|nr:Aspartate racemase [Coriobacteriaceae bacterium CHKCI002]